MQSGNSEGAKAAMKINSLTVFSAGMLISTSIFSVAYFSLKDDNPNSHNLPNDNVSSQEVMIAQLEEKGYIIMTQEELGQFKNDANKNVEETIENQDEESNEDTETGQAEENEDTESTQEEQTSPTEISITVSPGMTSYDIGKQLSAAGFIDIDAFTFSQEVEKRGLASKLQLGNYTVKNSMTIEEIISLFFR